MRRPEFSQTKDEVRRKLINLYPEFSSSSWETLDWDKGYDLCSSDRISAVKFSSNWFNPGRYEDRSAQTRRVPVQAQSLLRKVMSADSKSERFCRYSLAGKDLQVLGKTPYHIGLAGDKFRVVAATLQKCGSPFVRRSFHFTPSGIVETADSKARNGIPMAGKKVVTIRKFRVIRREERPDITPEKGKSLTIRLKVEPDSQTEAKNEQTENAKDTAGESTVSESEEIEGIKTEEEGQRKEEASIAKGSCTEATFKCHKCGRPFLTFQRYGAHMRSHLRPSCRICTKKFLTKKMLRDHMRTQHRNRFGKPDCASDDRITTATSKFGRTRRVLNVADLHSKYKML